MARLMTLLKFFIHDVDGLILGLSVWINLRFATFLQMIGPKINKMGSKSITANQA